MQRTIRLVYVLSGLAWTISALSGLLTIYCAATHRLGLMHSSMAVEMFALTLGAVLSTRATIDRNRALVRDAWSVGVEQGRGERLGVEQDRAGRGLSRV